MQAKTCTVKEISSFFKLADFVISMHTDYATQIPISINVYKKNWEIRITDNVPEACCSTSKAKESQTSYKRQNVIFSNHGSSQ